MAVGLILVIGGCAAVTTPEPSAVAGTAVPGSTDTVAVPSPDPAATSSPATAVPGSATPTIPPTPDPTTPPAPEPTAPPLPRPSPGSAVACSGTDENRDFYRAVADAVEWEVYCPVLPDGWFVDSGSYRLAGGGRLDIAYRGPGDARLELHEGAFCTESDGCVPDGPEVGTARLGDRQAALVAGDDGSWSIVADRASVVSWVLIARGVDEATARSIGDALALVDD